MSMKMWSTPGWTDYQLLDSGHGKRLEKFAEYILIRPDIKAQWAPSLPNATWQQADAEFIGEEHGRGEWRLRRELPEKWLLHWQHLAFWIKLTPIKHTGLFPEQMVQWQLLTEVISKAKQAGRQSIKMLNLFAYTGAATLAAAVAGAEVVTVDASKPAMNWFRENQQASGLLEKPVRLILEDVSTFVAREVKRGHTYDIIMMDPPAFGNGPRGEKWQFSKHFPELVRMTSQLVSEDALLLLINTYTEGVSESMLRQAIEQLSGRKNGQVEVGELGLQIGQTSKMLPTGNYAWWQPT
jgi:23S rRNA (cytosine1962-C5)-methyltransferase